MRRASKTDSTQAAIVAAPKKPKRMSYAQACLLGWQFTYRNIGGGRVACRAHHTARGLVTAWYTDDTDGRGAALAVLGEGSDGNQAS